MLAVGTKLGPHDTADENVDLLDPSRQTIIQIDVEPLNAAWTFPVDHVLVGDAGVVMDRLARRRRTAHAPSAPPAPSGCAEALEPLRRARARPSSAPTTCRSRRSASSAILHETFPDDATITCDAGENRLFMMHWYRSKTPGRYLQPAAGGGMGYAVPAAMAAKLACPDRPALAVCGDGGFAMSLHALMTAVQERPADRRARVQQRRPRLGAARHGRAGGGRRLRPVRPRRHRPVARAATACGSRAPSELRDAIKAFPDATRPFVIDVPTSLATSFRDVTQDIAAPAPRDRLLTDQYAATTRRQRSASSGWPARSNCSARRLHPLRAPSP